MKNTELQVISTGTLDRIALELTRDANLVSSLTRKNYLADLTGFEHWRGGRLLSKLLVEEYAAALRNGTLPGTGKLQPGTINRRLAAVRWWARRLAEHAHEDGSLNREMRDEIVRQAERVASIENVKGGSTHRGRHIADGELAALMRVCAEDETAAGVRDAAMLALAWSTGARRDEIARAWMEELKKTDGERMQLTLHGKGDKDRIAHLSGGVALALNDWLKLRGRDEGFIFCAILKSGRILLDHGLSNQALAKLLEKRRAQAGVAPLAWHDFRRSFAGNLLSGGVDIVTVQKMMGHASPTTTSIYDRRGDEIQRDAASKLHVPYTQRALLPARKVKKQS
jgi:site-specific recombinase XerD